MGMAHSIVVVCVTTVMAPGIGTLSGVARSTGAKQNHLATAYIRSGLVVGIFAGIFFAGAALVIPGQLDTVMNLNESMAKSVGASAEVYLKISLFAVLFQAPLFVLTMSLQGAGKAKLAFRISTIAPISNGLLDPVLIFDVVPGIGLPGFGLGLAGAAYASFFGYLFALIGAFWVITQEFELGHLSQWRVPGRFAQTSQILKVGVPSTIENLVRSAAILLLVRILSPFGEDVLAAFTAAIMIIMILIFPGIALGQATSTLVGQNLGAEKPNRAIQTALICVGLYAGFMLFASVGVYSFADTLITLFDKNDAVIFEGARLLKQYCFCFVGIAFALIISKVFVGAGSTLPPMISAVIAHLLIQIPLAIEWSETQGAAGAYSAMVVAFWVHGLINVFMLIYLRDKLVNSR